MTRPRTRKTGTGLTLLNSPQSTVENNTLYGGNGYYCWGPWGSIQRNNIVWARGSSHYAIYHERTDGTPISDYNNFYASDGAQVGYWAGARSRAVRPPGSWAWRCTSSSPFRWPRSTTLPAARFLSLLSTP